MENIATTVLIALGTGIAGSFSGWLFGRKKQRIEEIDLATSTWNKIVDSLEVQIDKLLQQRVADSEKIDNLSNRIKELQNEIEIMQSKIKMVETLERTISKYEKLLTDNNIKY
ncbi:MAG: hypothetical protein LBQ22_01925 [Bacteroidales bacterium]|jgi:peptidoglycan hydrolase CwlO-like protein|nr:hypothetical protein [Bacteroidales bacterium]